MSTDALSKPDITITQTDAKRLMLLAEENEDIIPAVVDVLYAELDRARTDQSFCVPKADVAANDYDLSINRYKEVVYDEIEYQAPAEILDELTRLEEEIQKGIEELKAILG